MPVVVPPTLTAAGLSPDRADRATFVARSIARDDFIKNTQIPQLQTAIDNVYNNAVDAYNQAFAARNDSISAATSASQAASAATAIQWVSGTTYAVGDARWSPATKISYRRLIAGAGTTDPSADATNWGAIVMPLAAGGTGATTASAARTALEAMHSGYMQVQDQKASGTAGGASTATAMTRTLNTVVTNTISGASLATNVITLPAGTYRVRAETMAVADTVASHITLYLQNTADAVKSLIGVRAYTGVGMSANPTVSGRFTIAATKTFTLVSQYSAANANGLGLPASFGYAEVYANIEIWKE